MSRREIKFRAWHETQRAYYSAEVLGEDQLTLSVDGRGLVNVHSGDRRLSEFAVTMVPEQFTGILDSKGIEIYEGDIVRIVRWKDSDDEAQVIGDVYFEKGMFKIQNGNAIAGTDVIGQFKPETLEVIGNVHKNIDILNPYTRRAYESR
jgi:uncharacterized phage protein (TIGR01671 family)